ncbi:MAG: hypothetical protein O3C40_06120 [Planctomycetota bacterium]|nr:hypothetical protein [Planctomycetota bacterium]
MAAIATSDESQRSATQLILRGEAQPFQWRSLNDGQRRAFQRIVLALYESVQRLSRVASHQDAGELSFYERVRDDVNQTLLLSGDRGTGKTSLLVSIARAMIHASEWDEEIRSYENARGTKGLTDMGRPSTQGSDAASYNIVGTKLATLREHVIWLEPLHMEILPGPTNLIAAILTRVEAIVDRLGVSGFRGESGHGRGILDVRSEYENTILELKRLTADVSLAWDGNLDERGANLDPDGFAAEVMRAERVRMALVSRFARVLDLIARFVPWDHGIHNPLFVLPVDDFDLNPPRCLELLRLLRMLRVPRLFSLILGDIRTMERVAQMHFTGEFAKIAKVRLHDVSAFESSLHGMHKPITNDALRKILPPAQRIYLKSLAGDEVLDFRPAGSDKTLKAWLAELKINLNATSESEETIPTVLDFVLPQLLPRGVDAETADFGSTDSAAYSVVRTFDAPARVVADIWFRVAQRAEDQIPGRPPSPSFVVPMYQEAVAADPYVTSDETETLQQVFEVYDATRRWEVHHEWVDVRFAEAPKQHSELGQVVETAVSLQLCTEGKWLVAPHRHRSEDPAEVAAANSRAGQRHLSNHATALFVLTHDMIACHPNHAPDRHLAPAPSEMCLAATVWRLPEEDVVVPWLAPPFRTFRSWDRFIFLWRQVNSRKFTELSMQTEADYLAFAWLAIGTSLLAPTTLSKPLSSGWLLGNKPLEEDWNDLWESIGSLTVLPKESATHRSFVRESWLRHVAMLLAPEVYLPSVFERLQRSPARKCLETFWLLDDQRWLIQQARARLAAKFYAQGKHELVKAFLQNVKGTNSNSSSQQKRDQVNRTKEVIARVIGESASGTTPRFPEWQEIAENLQSFPTSGSYDSRLRKLAGILQEIRKSFALVSDRLPPREMAHVAKEVDDQAVAISEQLSARRSSLNELGKGALCPTPEQIAECIASP